MALYLALVLEGRWKEIGDSVHVLRRVDNFLNRNLSMDSEVISCPSARKICFLAVKRLATRDLFSSPWTSFDSTSPLK